VQLVGNKLVYITCLYTHFSLWPEVNVVVMETTLNVGCQHR